MLQQGKKEKKSTTFFHFQYKDPIITHPQHNQRMTTKFKDSIIGHLLGTKSNKTTYQEYETVETVKE